MHSIKSLLSHLLAFILFISILLLSSTNAIKDLLTHHHVFGALQEINYTELVKINNLTNEEEKTFKELLSYIEYKDIIDDYLADKVLYELNIIKDEPKINLEALNEALIIGIEKFIDEKIYEYTSGLSSIIENTTIDSALREFINKIINDKTSIDLSNNQIITEEKIQPLYEEIDKMMVELKEDTYIVDIINVIYNDIIPLITIIMIITSIILLGIINRNVKTIAYMIAPIVSNALIFLIGHYFLESLKFKGGIEINALNYLTREAGDITFIYSIIFIGLSIAVIYLYNYVKKLLIYRSNKKEEVPVDTITSNYDYNSKMTETHNQEKE